MIKKIIEQLQLIPHPEGGWYRETWRSTTQTTLENGDIRSSGTSIYFLIPHGVTMHWHKVKSAEIWHFYSGSPLVLELKNNALETEEILMGNQLEAGFVPQATVNPNQWQRAYSLGAYSLVGCTVSPGFDFSDFTMTENEPI